MSKLSFSSSVLGRLLKSRKYLVAIVGSLLLVGANSLFGLGMDGEAVADRIFWMLLTAMGGNAIEDSAEKLGVKKK